jgi:hypothetical protein
MIYYFFFSILLKSGVRVELFKMSYQKKDKLRSGKGLFARYNRFQKNPYIIGERSTTG